MNDTLRIGVCGFGIAGGAAAVLLARAGHRVTLLERAPAVGPVGAGFLLQPSGQRVLAQLGLLERIVKNSARIERIEAFTDEGRRLTRLGYDCAGKGACAYGVRRGVVFEALHTAAIAAGVSMVLASDIRTVSEERESVFANDDAGIAHGPFDLLIGADGSRSQLRQCLNPDEYRREYVHGALWGSGRSAWPAYVLHQVARGAKRLLGLLPLGGGQCAFFWGIRRDELEKIKARGFASFREEAVEMCPSAAEVLDDIGSFERLTFAGYLHSLPKRIHSRRVVLLGDAAHAMSPHLGQGANLALLDAECLTRHLAISPLEAALDAYAVERKSQSRYLALLSRWLSPFFQSESNLLGLGRDIALPLLCAVPWTKRQMELTVTGAKRGFFDRL